MKKRQMSYLVCLVGLALCSPVTAEPVTLTIPGEGWNIAFDAPPITSFRGSTSEKDFRYQGASEEGFNVTLFVEKKNTEAHGHTACADYYWPLAKRNPMIDQSTVVIEKEKEFVKVSYRIRGEERGTKFDVPNINLYFEYKGKWIDVHISKFPFKDPEQKVLDGFVKSLKYKPASQQDTPKDADKLRR
jgi:hypothetical protein